MHEAPTGETSEDRRADGHWNWAAQATAAAVVTGAAAEAIEVRQWRHPSCGLIQRNRHLLDSF